MYSHCPAIPSALSGKRCISFEVFQASPLLNFAAKNNWIVSRLMSHRQCAPNVVGGERLRNSGNFSVSRISRLVGQPGGNLPARTSKTCESTGDRACHCSLGRVVL